MTDERELLESVRRLAQYPILRPTLVAMAEDVPVTRMMHARLLQSCGCSVVCFCDGGDLVTDFKSFLALGGKRDKFADFVLLDFDMPKMNGLASTVALRASGYVGDIAIVTANTEIREACLSAGATRVVAKPLTKDVLRELVTNISPSAHHGARSLSRVSNATTSQHAFALTMTARISDDGAQLSVIRGDELEASLSAAMAHLRTVLLALAAQSTSVAEEIAALHVQLALSEVSHAGGHEARASTMREPAASLVILVRCRLLPTWQRGPFSWWTGPARTRLVGLSSRRRRTSY